MSNSEIKERMVIEHSKKLGCKNTGVCWCETCVTIEKIVNYTIEKLKERLDE